MRFTISEINQPLHCVSFDSSKYPGTRALSVGRSSGCVFSLKNLSWTGSRVGRTHFSLLRLGDSWVALASSENHQLLYEGKPVTRVELQQPGCQFQFGNCLFTLDSIECPANSSAANFLLQISEGGSSRMVPVPAEGSLSIGREGSDCNVMLQTRYCSRTHAILRNQGEEVYLEDVSTNGTTIENRLLKNATQRVKPGQVISIDSARLQILAVNASPKSFKMIHLLLILLVGAVGVLLAVHGKTEPEAKVKKQGAIPQIISAKASRDNQLEEKLGHVYLRDFFEISALDSTVINNMTELEFSKLLDDSAMWKHLHRQLQELERRKSRFLQTTNEHWPLPEEVSPESGMATPDFTALEQGISSLLMLSLQEPLLKQLAQLKNSWSTIQVLEEKLRQANRLFQQKNLEAFQKLRQELVPIEELEKTRKTWEKLLLVEKILMTDQQIALAEKEFSGETVSERCTQIQDRLKMAVGLAESLPDIPDKKLLIQKLQKLSNACQLFEQLQKYSFHRLDPLAIQEFDRAKNAALSSALPTLEKLAIAKNNSCLQSFDYFVNSLEPQKKNLTWHDVEKAGNAMNSLHMLTANIAGSGQRKQEIDTNLRNKIDSMQQELNKILIARQKTFLASGRKNRELLTEMLPLAEPKGRWHTWIEKQLQQFPQ